MDTWAVTLLLSCLVLAFFLQQMLRQRQRLPPGPSSITIIAHLLWVSRTVSEFEFYLKNIWAKYGPLATVKLGSFAMVMVADRHLAHKMLIGHGAIFADRPPPSLAVASILGRCSTIASAGYGPTWRVFRRNLAGVSTLPIAKNTRALQWSVQIMIGRLRGVQSESPGHAVQVREIFQHSVIFLTFVICFGEKPDEEALRRIDDTVRTFLRFVSRLNLLTMVDKFYAYLFKESYNDPGQSWLLLKDTFLPLIRSHLEKKEAGLLGKNNLGVCYLDRLVDLRIEENRSLTEDEILVLCSEFFLASVENTTYALEWTMANLVKNSAVQEKLVEEVLKKPMDDDLQNIPYLKAVVFEGLRRHPPSHLLFPHAVSEDVTLNGYTFPKGTTVNFGVAQMNLDGDMWPNPLEFRPERFLAGGEGEKVDITGRNKIQMISFGVGQRMCPGMSLALLNLQYLIGNLVQEFIWDATSGGVDLSEKHGLVISMKNPLRVCISSRRTSATS